MGFRNRCRVWTIDMGDGTWAVSCERCGALGRRRERIANLLARRHTLPAAS